MKVLLFLQIVVRVLFLNHLMSKAGKICMIGGFSVLFFWMDGRNIFTSPIYSAMLLLVIEVVFFIIDKRKFHAEDLFSCCVLESGIAVCNAAAIYVVSMILYNNLDYKLLHNLYVCRESCFLRIRNGIENSCICHLWVILYILYFWFFWSLY